MTATERYTEVLMKILRCGHIKISELQEEFQVSRSTIKRGISRIVMPLCWRSRVTHRAMVLRSCAQISTW